jgi:SAM-dependent methyltransferase
LGVDIARNLVEAGKRRAQEMGLKNLQFQEGDATNLAGLQDKTFDLVISIFGAMFAPKPFDVAKEMVRVTRPGGRIVMGNWIPNDPTLVAQILKISAGVPRDNVFFQRENCLFNFPGTPSGFVDTFRRYYGPTMNAFEAAEKTGRAEDLRSELSTLFESQNSSTSDNVTIIAANFLRVTVAVK